MANMKKHGLRRLLAFLLLAVCLCGVFPSQAFAASVGQKASSWLGGAYVGSDGRHYTSPAPYTYLAYQKDGTVDVHTSSGGTDYRHYMLTDSDGVTHPVFCVESGIPYHTSDNTYTSESGKNSGYLNLLPSDSRRGIILTSIYGWKPGASLPVSGINEDDYKMATQIILWEYQQQLRSDPYSRHGNGHASADQYFSVIAGRPAERAYDWILRKVASHDTVPSFTASAEKNAPVLELEWDTRAKVYTLTVTDTNNLKIDLETLSGSDVTVKRSGNQYTFTSRQMLMDPVTFKFRKDVPVAEDMLIWGRPGYQTMMTGASDPVSFYVKVKTETYGTARIVKTSEDGIVSGIQFNISGTDILGNKVNEDVTTGKDGQVEKQFLPGTYLVKELPVDRYVTPPAQYVTIESGQTATVHFSNILKKFRVHVVKSDNDTGTAQGDATLAGATYGIYNNGELVDTYTTGPEGDFMTRYYVCGDAWTIREIEPSTGYLLNDTVYEVGASPTLYEVELNTTENQVKETVIYGNIRLVKHTDDNDPDVAEGEHSTDGNAGQVEKPEAGAVFEVFLKSAGSYEAAKETERDLLTTDENGFASSGRLPYGQYTVHQTAGEEGKAFIPDFTVFISEDGQTYSYILNNTTITARLKVEKCDAETGNIIPVAGTGFQIKDLSTGKFVSQEIFYPNPETLDTFYVSDEGWLMLPEPLAAGDYELCEVAAPYGYVLSDEPIPFTVDGSEAVVTVKQHNMPQKAELAIRKTGEVFASVQENEGLYQPVYEVQGLPGAVYDLVADEDIYTGDGTLRAAKDTVIETLTTGEDGTAVSGLLYLGHYRLEEKEAPAGMVAATEPERVELAYAGETVEVTKTEKGLYDERQKAAVGLTKSLETDGLFGFGEDGEYQDISFGLYAASDLTAADGSVIPADGLLEVVSVSENGAGGYEASFASDLPFGSYYVKERTTNEAYILSNKEYPVIFAYAGQDTAVVEIAANEGEPIANKLLRGHVDGVKYGENPEGGEDVTLAGALVGLFGPDVEEFTEGNALLTVSTQEDGSFAFEGIPYGHWIIAEIAAPELYTISEEQHHVYIGVDGQHLEIRIDNTLIRGRVQVRKTEAVDEPSPVDKKEDKNTFLRFLSGAVFELYGDTNGNKELDQDDRLLGTLTETDGGYHTAENLLAGGYFVKEKTAPEGYRPDEKAYHFEITEDGQTAVIENGETGRGFSNEAYRGNLKITKDSSDGRRDGFAIEVKSADGSYCETFTTPKSGVIEVKGLRVGIYTVTEISNRASRDYIIPDAATVEIRADKTATVQLFNEKPEKPKTPEEPKEPVKPETPKNPDTPKTPETPRTPATPSTPYKAVPQTGDDSLVFLWGGFLALAVLGGGASAAVIFYRGRHGKKTGRAAKAASLALSLLLAAGSGWMLAHEIGEYRQGVRAYGSLEELVEQPDPEETKEPEGLPSVGEVSGEENGPVLPVVDFEGLRETGPDIVAWLTLPDTPVNYPVTQTEDNEFYLDHLHDRSPGKVGCLFADYENSADFSDRNTIIYGHNMRDGSMFAELNHYKEQAYFESHPQMYLVTPEGGFVCEVFAAFTADPEESGSDASPWRLGFRDDGAYTTWLGKMAERSVAESGVTVTSSDRVLTLSTCAPGGEKRFVVMGKLVEVEN